MPRAPKVQRWTDLPAALLRRRFATEFRELAREVPAYADESQGDAERMRMFERDTDELRCFGVPIESVVMDDAIQPSRPTWTQASASSPSISRST